MRIYCCIASGCRSSSRLHMNRIHLPPKHGHRVSNSSLIIYSPSISGLYISKALFVISNYSYWLCHCVAKVVKNICYRLWQKQAKVADDKTAEISLNSNQM